MFYISCEYLSNVVDKHLYEYIICILCRYPCVVSWYLHDGNQTVCYSLPIVGKEVCHLKNIFSKKRTALGLATILAGFFEW